MLVKCHLGRQDFYRVAVALNGSIRGVGLPSSDFRGRTSDVHLLSGLNFKISRQKRGICAGMASDIRDTSGEWCPTCEAKEMSDIRGKRLDGVQTVILHER